MRTYGGQVNPNVQWESHPAHSRHTPGTMTHPSTTVTLSANGTAEGVRVWGWYIAKCNCLSGCISLGQVKLMLTLSVTNGHDASTAALISAHGREASSRQLIAKWSFQKKEKTMPGKKSQLTNGDISRMKSIKQFLLWFCKYSTRKKSTWDNNALCNDVVHQSMKKYKIVK